MGGCKPRESGASVRPHSTGAQYRSVYWLVTSSSPSKTVILSAQSRRTENGSVKLSSSPSHKTESCTNGRKARPFIFTVRSQRSTWKRIGAAATASVGRSIPSAAREAMERFIGRNGERLWEAHAQPRDKRGEASGLETVRELLFVPYTFERDDLYVRSCGERTLYFHRRKDPYKKEELCAPPFIRTSVRAYWF